METYVRGGNMGVGHLQSMIISSLVGLRIDGYDRLLAVVLIFENVIHIILGLQNGEVVGT